MNTTTPKTPAQAMTVPQREVKKSESLSTLLKQPVYQARFNEVLGKRAPQFISSVLSLGASMPDVEPQSIIASCMIAATLDLPIDKNLGFAWIVPYRKDGKKYAQFQMGYKGYVQLALRTCQYARLNVCEVYEGELTKYDKFTGEIVLDPLKKTSDKVIGYATYLKLTFGFEHADFWTTDEVIKHAETYSKAFQSAKKYKDDDSPWIASFDDMARKTVLAMHIRKWGPMSVQIQTASQADQGIKRSLDAEIEYIDNDKTPTAPQFDTPPQPEALPAPATPEPPPANVAPLPQDEDPLAEPEPQKRTTLEVQDDERKMTAAQGETPAAKPDPTAHLDADAVTAYLHDLMKRDGVSEDQVIAHLRNTKVAKSNQTELAHLSDTKRRTIVAAWDRELPAIKAITV